jgi:riboflavin synthase
MFTGIVEETGTIEGIEPSANSIRMKVRSELCAREAVLGESVAVNGCCLTVAAKGGRGKARWMEFDLLRETWDRTGFHAAQAGQAVNLERALRVGGRLGGHFVSGHIDGVGVVRHWEQPCKDWFLEIKTTPEIMRYVIPKGSIAVDGISLTVGKVAKGSFQVWIIPHTWKVTALREKKVGDLVNLEADLIGKYVEKLVLPRRS